MRDEVFNKFRSCLNIVVKLLREVILMKIVQEVGLYRVRGG